MRAKVETIDPDRARELLGMNTGNFRRLDMARVALFAKEMSSGNWELNGESIKFSGDLLLDGQHRLAAVIESGTEIDTIVVYGCGDVSKTIDRGKPRTIAQWLNHEGVKNSTSVAAMAKYIIMYDKGQWSKSSMLAYRVADSDIFEFVADNESGLQRAFKQAATAKGLLPTTLLGTIVFVACRDYETYEADIVGWFCRSLKEGTELTEEDAVLHLRNRLLSQRPGARLDKTVQRALATIAWNKTVKGESCSLRQLTLRMTGPTKQKPPGHIEPVEADE